ncbi:hypothetical protein [Oryza sativa Japonica Group]|uniref:Uncharacterized protein n=2 Tax=Oryza sativa subsp. japonica TaxID=39947 RepID=Q5VRU8_ORYSJ|nr:hypothetical protein [Oryza sativa Japonica Group]BAD68080.1 hypothetical protein [Oryza sativa Japonica Group]
MGFSIARPIAAYLIYRCLIHWKSFEEDRTTVFDCIIQKISAATEMAVWGIAEACTPTALAVWYTGLLTPTLLKCKAAIVAG